MTFTEEQIEWIVAEVLRRLDVAGKTSRPATDGNGTDFRITERVITMRTIEARLSGVKRLLVQPRSVVTPAVKDELRARNVELVFEQE